MTVSVIPFFKMKSLLVFFVDAFTEKPYQGNPAAVCFAEQMPDESLMQSMAFEIGFSETAFVSPLEEPGHFKLRWFTPAVEIPLCGHGTLSAAKVLFEYYTKENRLVFHTMSGLLSATQNKEGIVLDFPMDFPENIDFIPIDQIIKTLQLDDIKGLAFCQLTGNILIEISDKEALSQINPDFRELGRIDIQPFSSLTVTCQGDEDFDFYSRNFSPWEGINEDPVTGSAHTALFPYWKAIKKKNKMKAKQISQRSGILELEEYNSRLLITGKARIMLKGEFYG